MAVEDNVISLKTGACSFANLPAALRHEYFDSDNRLSLPYVAGAWHDFVVQVGLGCTCRLHVLLRIALKALTKHAQQQQRALINTSPTQLESSVQKPSRTLLSVAPVGIYLLSA